MAPKQEQVDFSWASGANRGARSPRSGLRARLRIRSEDSGILDAVAVVAFLAVFDLVMLLILTGWQSAVCGGNCGLHTQLRLLHQGELIVPIAVFVPPVLASLLMGRRRILVLILQLLLCSVLTMNNLSHQHLIHQRLNGAVPCWNPLYSPAECPWGVK